VQILQKSKKKLFFFTFSDVKRVFFSFGDFSSAVAEDSAAQGKFLKTQLSFN